jgi:predicted GIY-YIG superfamily endonuclease
MPPSGYTVYVLIDPRDMVPFYVGMTCRRVARWTGHNSSRGSRVYTRLAELRELRLKCRVRLASMDLSLDEARDRERQLIALHRETLLNWRPRRRPQPTERAA